MTIDEAIKYADLMSLDMLRMENLSGKDMQELGKMCGDALRKSEKLDKLIEKVEEVWKVAPVCDTCHKGIAVYRWEEVNDDLEEVTYQECTACHKKRIQKMMEKFVN